MSGDARGWLDSPSEEAVCGAVRRVAPPLARLPVTLNDRFESGDPLWHRGSAWLGDDHIVKFAWSEQAAAERLREVRVVRVLAETRFAEWMPRVDAGSECPVLLISRCVAGIPVDGRLLADVAKSASIASSLARALAVLHDPLLLDRVAEAGIPLPAPTPQAETAAIRARLPPSPAAWSCRHQCSHGTSAPCWVTPVARTEAGVPLPDEGTLGDWIVSLCRRITQLNAWRPVDAPG